MTIIGVVVLLVALYSVVRYFLDQAGYNQGHAARAEARCEEAIQSYKGVIDAFHLLEFGDFERLSRIEWAECIQFADASTAETGGKQVEALFGYQNFIATYPGSPLAVTARGRMAALLSATPPSALAGDSFCGSIEPLAVAASLGSDNPAWPGFYAACADFYQQSGDDAKAYALYTRVLGDYPASPAARSATRALLDSTYACGQAGEVMGMPVLASDAQYLPYFLNNCGERYEASAAYADAARVYLAFMDAFPNHAAFEQVKVAYARAAIAAARDQGAGEIAAPMQVGGEAGATTVVVIQNDSPNALHIVLSGPETRIEAIEPCAACATFIEEGPEFCPEQGPVGTYELPPGVYEVMVESSSDSDITPFTGTWDLTGGEYYSCFLIISSAN